MDQNSQQANDDFYTLRLAEWGKDGALLRHVRREVFIHEQHIPEALEWDEHDPICTHLLALNQAGEAIGTARLLSDGHIGRVAVLKDWRGKQVGAELIKYLIKLNKLNGHADARLSAQVRAMAFYASLGFVAEGETYLDADIPHQMMRLVY